MNEPWNLYAKFGEATQVQLHYCAITIIHKCKPIVILCFDEQKVLMYFLFKIIIYEMIASYVRKISYVIS